MNKSGQKILFYDGECGLCQRSVSFLAKRDSKKELKFAPLNGETYKKYFKVLAKMETVLYLECEGEEKKVFEKSSAIVRCLQSLGGINSLVGLIKLIPRPIRDIFYDYIASNRNKSNCAFIAKDDRFLN